MTALQVKSFIIDSESFDNKTIVRIRSDSSQNRPASPYRHDIEFTKPVVSETEPRQLYIHVENCWNGYSCDAMDNFDGEVPHLHAIIISPPRTHDKNNTIKKMLKNAESGSLGSADYAYATRMINRALESERPIPESFIPYLKTRPIAGLRSR